MKTYLTFAVILVSASAFADTNKFSAADVTGVKLKRPGRIVISNTASRITAFHFFGDVKEALVSLKTAPLSLNPFGSAIYDSNARVSKAIPAELAAVIADASRTHGVDPRLVAAVARRESAFNANAMSPVGACGIMQLMPATARFLGVTNIFDSRENVFAGARYLRTLLDTFHGDLDLTLAAYNAGPGAVRKFNGVPPFRETQAYVKNVRAYYEASLR